MVLSIVRIVPRRNEYEHTLRVLGAFADSVRPLPGCESVQILACSSSQSEVVYMESWRDRGRFERHVGSPQYELILELIETSSEPPRVEYHLVSEVRGAEWLEQLRASGPASTDPSAPKLQRLGRSSRVGR